MKLKPRTYNLWCVICILCLVPCGLLYAQNLNVDGDLEINSTASDQRHGLILKLIPQPAQAGPQGQVIYDSNTNKPWYSDGAVWRTFGMDKNVATQIVAASNSLDQSRANWTCSGTNDQVTIQNAITALGSNPGVVYLLEGTYNISGPIVLDDGILGNSDGITDSGKAIIGAGAGTVLSGTAAATNVIYANNVNHILISQLRIDGNNRTGGGVGIRWLSVTDSKIDKVWVENMRGEGILFWPSCSNNIISGSTLWSNADVGIKFLDSSNNNTISGNNIQGNSISLSYGGMRITDSLNNVISGNNIQANQKHGIMLEGSSNNTISGNNIQSNVYSGINITNTSDNSVSNNTISGNNIQGNGWGGIYFSTGNSAAGANNIISGNNIQGNTQDGIYLAGVAAQPLQNNIISGNRIDENGGAGNYDGIKVYAGCYNNIISSNRIYDASGTGYGINITNNDNRSNYLISNLIDGTGYIDTDYDRRIQDSGNGTKYTDKVKITLERSAVLTVNNNSTLGNATSLTSYLPVIGYNGAVSIWTIAPGKAIGDILILEGTDNSNKVRIYGRTSYGNVLLGPSYYDLKLDDVLTLIWNGTFWLALHYANN